MTTSLYDLTVGSYSQILGATVNFLEQGKIYCQEQSIELSEIVQTSLYENMLDFHFQVVSLNHHSTKTIDALASGEFEPPMGYPPMDYDGLLEMTKASVASMATQDAATINALAGKHITFKLSESEMPFTTENFVMSFSLPNFYFHATTAFDILRMKGVPIGKRDFLGAMKMGG